VPRNLVQNIYVETQRGIAHKKHVVDMATPLTNNRHRHF